MKYGNIGGMQLILKHYILKFGKLYMVVFVPFIETE